MAIREVLITPNMASELLEKNSNNRPLSERKADKLANSMKAGEWKYNGDAIRISRTGVLLDGQHRLRAIEKSRIPQKSILIDGLDDEVFTTIDIGSARTPAHMLGIVGLANAGILASSGKLILNLKLMGRPIHGTPDKAPTHTQIVDFAENDKLLHAAATFATRKWIQRYVTQSIGALCWYIFGKHNPHKRDEFFHELETGEFSYPSSPIRFARDMLIEDRGASYSPDKTRRIAVLFKAYRLFAAGEQSKIIRLGKDQEEWFKI
jgi:hypothetical protein